MKKVVSIIPARGGSKGIKKKNIAPLLGKPLISYTIETAKACSLIDRVIVSTDCNEIAKVSIECGAEVINRPNDISGDFASSEEALLHAISELEKHNYRPDVVVFMQCTSPLISVNDLKKALIKFIACKADSLFTATKFNHFLWEYSKDGCIAAVGHDSSVRLMRQEKKEQFLEVGSVYIMDCEKFKKSKHRFFGKIEISLIDKDKCLEIDDPIDLKIAETILKDMQKQGSCNL